MDKWPEDYECDGQLSMFPVRFEDCMNPPEEDENEGVQSNTENRGTEPQYKSEGTEQITGDRNSTEVG